MMVLNIIRQPITRIIHFIYCDCQLKTLLIPKHKLHAPAELGAIPHRLVDQPPWLLPVTTLLVIIIVGAAAAAGHLGPADGVSEFLYTPQTEIKCVRGKRAGQTTCSRRMQQCSV